MQLSERANERLTSEVQYMVITVAAGVVLIGLFVTWEIIRASVTTYLETRRGA